MSLADMQDAKEQVRQAVDIVELVGGYLQLRRQGRNFVGLCPWHDDSRPSMQVNPERQSFKCWVCDIGGDIFTFLMRIEGVEFREALEMLAERAGVELSQRPANQSPTDSQFERSNLLKALAWAEQQFHQALLKSPAAEPARKYLADRGINDESVEKFHIGFSPNEWEWLTKRGAAAGFSPAVLERVGCAGKRDSGGYYDRFRGRLMFSIRDVRSRPIAFGGRVLPEFAGERDAKYINSPETPLFSKSRELYALDVARDGVSREGEVVVMEGYTDVIMAHQHGIDHAVAVLGTALGEQHVPLVKRFTDTITLVLDGDEAGQRRTMDILDNLLALFIKFEIELKVLGLPEGADPCDVVVSQGSDAFRELLASSKDALTHKMDFVMQTLAQQSGASSTHDSAQAVESILATLARALPGGVSSTSSALVREQQMVGRIARQFGLADDTLRTRLKALRKSQAKPQATRPTQSAIANMTDDEEMPDESAFSSAPATKPTAWDQELIELILLQPEAMTLMSTQVSGDDATSESAKEIFQLARDLHEVGILPTYEQLMLATDDEQIKSLLVDCDERNSLRDTSDPQLRLSDLFATAARRREEARHQNQLAQLRQHKLDDDSEDEVLRKLFGDLERGQSGSSPTEG
ncbi:DNA primase [Adhaeretor mobilis]|uniref:DNA primase n=1 Tax=Adhaeretor mobilis TaxID=1930276 RepID=A0A517MUM8_9BACT|nr:DNA primase [Adhaeretor mobilis]QDS98579.1 DNA primase [Adhaeretor mobilis]